LSLAGLAAIGLESLRLSGAIRILAGIVIAVDLYLVGSGRPMNTASINDDPPVTRQSFEGSAQLLSEIRRHVNENSPPWRIDTIDANINWATCATITRVPTANGVSPLALENIIQLRLFLHDGYRWGWYYPVEKVGSPVLDLMNVKYVITRGESAGRLLASPKYRHVESLPGYELFENLSVMPRYFLVHEAKRAESLAEARRLIDEGAIDFRRTAITAQTVPLLPGASSNVADDVRVTQYLPDSLELSVVSSSPAFLVLSESYYPGWEAWLDGTPTPIYQTDIAFRGVAMPVGRHVLRMQFRPGILPWSAALSLATALFLTALAFLRINPAWPVRR
jgi:hypothetical protein